MTTVYHESIQKKWGVDYLMLADRMIRWERKQRSEGRVMNIKDFDYRVSMWLNYTSVETCVTIGLNNRPRVGDKIWWMGYQWIVTEVR